MAELLTYLGGFHAIFSLLCPKEQGLEKRQFLQILSVGPKVETN